MTTAVQTEAAQSEDRATMADAPPYRGTRLHSMRVPDEVWDAALERAGAEGSTITAEVVAFLRAYGAGERYNLRARKQGAR